MQQCLNQDKLQHGWTRRPPIVLLYDGQLPNSTGRQTRYIHTPHTGKGNIGKGQVWTTLTGTALCPDYYWLTSTSSTATTKWQNTGHKWHRHSLPQPPANRGWWLRLLPCLACLRLGAFISRRKGSICTLTGIRAWTALQP
jgi:hypothetical protein